MEPVYRPEVSRRSHSCAQWDFGRRIPSLAQRLPACRRPNPSGHVSMTCPLLCTLSLTLHRKCVRSELDRSLFSHCLLGVIRLICHMTSSGCMVAEYHVLLYCSAILRGDEKVLQVTASAVGW